MSADLENQLAAYGRWFRAHLDEQPHPPTVEQDVPPRHARLKLIVPAAAAAVALIAGLVVISNRADDSGSATSLVTPVPVTTDAFTGCGDRKLALDEDFPTSDGLDLTVTEFGDDGFVAMLTGPDGGLALTACQPISEEASAEGFAIGSFRAADDGTVAVVLAYPGTDPPPVAAHLPAPRLTRTSGSITSTVHVLDESWTTPADASTEVEFLGSIVEESRAFDTISQTVFGL